ncbi:MAG: NNMT/PNMT/TEMT family class I SAM-dependent methyltransferase [Terricaulis sp.]|nr:NNMT/PNMT/TEMT family class I SAM-dependent methyltransferase [Terricaulis sp.]
MSKRAPQSNDEFAWARFDPEAYVAHYYADPHPDDDEVVRLTARALAAGAGDGAIDTIDVGTGPNLFPLLAALPVARRVSAWEYSEANVAWLRKELAGGRLRAPWAHFWEVARGAHDPARAAIAEPIAALSAKTDIVQGSIFDLPPRQWDAATMFFCAESITEQQEEFERACAAFAGAVRPGGVLAAAFLAGSKGYQVGAEDFPAVSVNPAALEAAFAGIAGDIVISAIGERSEEIRSGYTGMLFLTARAR